MSQKFNVVGMNCASCVTRIENKLEKVDGINTTTVDFTDETVTVESECDVEAADLQEHLDSDHYTILEQTN